MFNSEERVVQYKPDRQRIVAEGYLLKILQKKSPEASSSTRVLAHTLLHLYLRHDSPLHAAKLANTLIGRFRLHHTTLSILFTSLVRMIPPRARTTKNKRFDSDVFFSISQIASRSGANNEFMRAALQLYTQLEPAQQSKVRDGLFYRLLSREEYDTAAVIWKAAALYHVRTEGSPLSESVALSNQLQKICDVLLKDGLMRDSPRAKVFQLCTFTYGSLTSFLLDATRKSYPHHTLNISKLLDMIFYVMKRHPKAVVRIPPRPGLAYNISSLHAYGTLAIPVLVNKLRERPGNEYWITPGSIDTLHGHILRTPQFAPYLRTVEQYMAQNQLAEQNPETGLEAEKTLSTFERIEQSLSPAQKEEKRLAQQITKADPWAPRDGRHLSIQEDPVERVSFAKYSQYRGPAPLDLEGEPIETDPTQLLEWSEAWHQLEAKTQDYIDMHGNIHRKTKR